MSDEPLDGCDGTIEQHLILYAFVHCERFYGASVFLV